MLWCSLTSAILSPCLVSRLEQRVFGETASEQPPHFRLVPPESGGGRSRAWHPPPTSRPSLPLCLVCDYAGGTWLRYTSVACVAASQASGSAATLGDTGACTQAGDCCKVLAAAWALGGLDRGRKGGEEV